MANKLGVDLTGKKVVMEGDCPEADRTVTVESGFGARPELRGSTIYARDVQGNLLKMDAYEVERIA